MLKYGLPTEEQEAEYSNWTYDNQFAIYNNYDRENTLDGKIITFTDCNVLVGIAMISEEEKDVYIGIAVNPVLFGKGYGTEIAICTREFISKSFPTKKPYIEVHTWNKQAIHCFQKAGFIISEDSFQQTTCLGDGEYHRMELST